MKDMDEIKMICYLLGYARTEIIYIVVLTDSCMWEYFDIRGWKQKSTELWFCPIFLILGTVFQLANSNFVGWWCTSWCQRVYKLRWEKVLIISTVIVMSSWKMKTDSKCVQSMKVNGNELNSFMQLQFHHQMNWPSVNGNELQFIVLHHQNLNR